MISRGERWSYAAGDLGFNFVWQSVELYLLFYYIRGLGIAPEVASAIFLVGAAVDYSHANSVKTALQFGSLYRKQPYLGGLPLVLLNDRFAFLREAILDVWADPLDAQHVRGHPGVRRIGHLLHARPER